MTPVEVLERCMREAGGDVAAGLAAAEYILSNRLDVTFSTDSKEHEHRGTTSPLSAFFAHDIHNRHAQGILNRSLQAARGLSAVARADLAKALERGASDSGQAILEFINKYRLQLAKLLSTTQLASLLEGAREVAAKVPVLDSDAEAVRESVGDIPLPTFPIEDDIHFPTIDEAAKELAGKNVLSRQGYYSLDAAARAKAFTVAGVDAEDALTKIRDVLAENVREGADYATFKQEVLDAVDEGTFLSDSHQEVVFRTNVQSAFSDGQMTVLSHPLVRSGFPYAVYDAIHDDRVRHNHLALEKLGIDGTNVYRIDDPVFQMFRPPWDYQDRCSWTPITVRQASERGIPEAQQWLDSGIEPSPPAHVPMPAFAPPPGFQRAIASAPLSIRLSMQPIATFAANSKNPSFKDSNSNPDDYPRDNSNRFLDKYTITEAARDPTHSAELRESLHEEQRWKLDRIISHLQSGGTVHHPKESPGLAINIDGKVADPRWADYAEANLLHEMWEERNAERRERRKCVEKAVKLLRKGDADLDDVDDLLEEAGATDAELRALSKMRHQVDVDKDDPDSLEDLYEETAESIHLRLDVEEATDIEPDQPEEPDDVQSPISIGAAFATDGGRWITIGGRPRSDPKPEVKHAGGFPVFIDGSGTIKKGRLRGTNVSNVKAYFDKMKGGNGAKRSTKELIASDKAGVATRRATEARGAGVGPGGRADGSQPDATGGRVAKTPARPGDPTIGEVGQDSDKPIGNEVAETTGPERATTSTRATKSIEKVNRQLDRYTNYFNTHGFGEMGEWMGLLKEHVNKVGVANALSALGEERSDTSGLSRGAGKVAYKGTGEFDDSVGTDFVKGYLDRAGIMLQIGDVPTPGVPVIAPAPISKELRGGYKKGDVIPTETPIEDKLEESKLLPGLESTEDINVIAGRPVTQLTPDVLSKLDAKYGEGKWIIKSFGDEAFASFGIFFPQRVQQIQNTSKATLLEVGDALKAFKWSLTKNEAGETIGFTKDGEDGIPGKGRFVKFGTNEFDNLKSGTLKELGRIAHAAAPYEGGARLPASSEESLQQNFGIKMRRDEQGKMIGIIDSHGENIDFGTPEYDTLYEDKYFPAHDVDKVIEWEGAKSELKFMVSPAFQSIGVTEEERALGMTWETSTEGRVHVTTRNGKASVVPYATLARRKDSLPAVFYDQDLHDMERAVQETIDALPESSRTGQTYAPDVMKTADGWKVVELNASVESGTSLWLEKNPLVMDAYVSHMTGREPAHVKFVRKLLRDKMRGTEPNAAPPRKSNDTVIKREGEVGEKAGSSGVQFSTEFEEEDHPRRGTGEGGGQFTRVNTGDRSTQSAPVATAAEDIPTIEPMSEQEQEDENTRLEKVERVNKRITKYADHFREKGYDQLAYWMGELQEHIGEVGYEKSLEALGEAREEGTGEEVAYRSTMSGSFEDNAETKFVKDYLDRVGIALQMDNAPIPGKRTLASAPVTPEDRAKYKEDDVLPSPTNLKDKLEESKHLPGLESTEDLDTIAGERVTHLTPNVISDLDKRYGKNKWIIKSYGDEAYAGFGILLPQRVKQIQHNAQWAIYEGKKTLRPLGWSVTRGEDGLIDGLINQFHEEYKFGTAEYGTISNIEVKRLGNQIRLASPDEKATRLPGSSEENLQQNYGITIRRDDSGRMVGITERDNKQIDFDTPEYEKFEADNASASYQINRAKSWGGVRGEVKFMAQPAYEAIGTTEEDRALGMTWETSTEGRVHLTIKDGKASVIPYATLAGREDSMPVVFANDDVRAMEKAAQEAIDALPESERTGQVYAPDVMKDTDGKWHVLEANASVESGSSAWLESNPMVIDAYVSHILGRDPTHVKFVRNLLGDRLKSSRKSSKPRKRTNKSREEDDTKDAGVPLGHSFDEENHPRKGKGKEGGRFVEKEDAKGGGRVRTVKLGRLKVQYSIHKSKQRGDNRIPLKNYKQWDVHSCGFVAALTISRYFKPDTTAKEVLKAVRPTINNGVNRHNLISSLKKLGIEADYRKDLTVEDLRKYVKRGTPVIISVWPDNWISDHWTVVQGFDDDKVYLTNHKSIPLNLLKKQWSDMDMRGRGNSKEGLVCLPIGLILPEGKSLLGGDLEKQQQGSPLMEAAAAQQKKRKPPTPPTGDKEKRPPGRPPRPS